MVFCNFKRKLIKPILVFLLFLLCFPLTIEATFKRFEFQGMMFVGWWHESQQKNNGTWWKNFGYSAKTNFNTSYNFTTKVGVGPVRAGWVKSIDALIGDNRDINGSPLDKNHPTKLNYIGVEFSWRQNNSTDNDMYRLEPTDVKCAEDEYSDIAFWDDGAWYSTEYAGPDGSGITGVIDYIHSKGLNIMLYPMIRLGGATWADLRPTDKDVWFTNYRNKILKPYAQMLVNHYRPGDIFCIGQELITLANSTAGGYSKQRWIDAINDVKTIFNNAGLDVPLVYGANWDNFENVDFWDQLDYAGISAYFPLKDGDSPGIDEIKAAWFDSDVPGYDKNWVSQLETFHNTTNNVDGVPIPIIFTEIGYASKKEAAKIPNEGAWSGQTGGKGKPNEDAYGTPANPYKTGSSYWGGADSDQDEGDYDGDLQARCYQAAMEVFMPYADGTSGDWFKGFFWWHWQTWREGGNWRNDYVPTGDWLPTGTTTQALQNITYTPQYKPAHLKKGTDGGKYILAIGYNDSPKPELINPPPLLMLGKDVPYGFQFKATDADTDRVRYTVDWGDGATYGPTAFGNSGWVDMQSHSWANIGVTTITIRATDNSGNGPEYNSPPEGDGSDTWNPNDTGELEIYLNIKPLPTVSNMEFYHQVSDVAPGWPPLAWAALDEVDGKRRICNDEEVKLKTTFADVIAGDTITWVRYYYEANSSTASVTTYYDVGSDIGTSYYVAVPTTPVEIVGTDVKYESVFPVDINNAGSYINIQASAKIERQSIGTIYTNSNENYYIVNSTGTVGTGAATDGNRNYYVLTGRGAMSEPYPLQWNVVDVSFSTYTATNYSPLRHGNREPSSAPATLEVGSTNYYYFMPGGVAPNNPLYDVCVLYTSHFTQRGAGTDGYGDLFINESPIMYLRASNLDLSTNSSLEYNSNNSPGPWSVANSVALSTFTALNIRENINPVTGTAAENKKGYGLNYYYLQPVNYTFMMNNLAEGTTVYYYYKLRDIDPVSAGLSDTQYWKKKLGPSGVKQDTDVISNFYSFEILQDDMTPPYILASPGQTHSMRPISPALEHPSTIDWIFGYYTITAQINDTRDGTGSFSAGDYSFSSNPISGRGESSSVYVNPANPASGTFAPYSPVHDSRVYYMVTSSTPGAIVANMGGGYDATEQYFTGNARNAIDYDAPTKISSAYWGGSWDFQDADIDGFGYVQMISTGTSTWSGNIPLREEYLSGGSRYVYYRIYTSNNDTDPQAYITPSGNRLSIGTGNPSFGYGDTTGSYNNHGTPGNAWNDPFSGTARDSDRDHAWAMWTRSGGQLTYTGPPMIKVTSEVTISGTKRKVITYLDGSGGQVGKVLFTEIK